MTQAPASSISLSGQSFLKFEVQCYSVLVSAGEILESLFDHFCSFC